MSTKKISVIAYEDHHTRSNMQDTPALQPGYELMILTDEGARDPFDNGTLLMKLQSSVTDSQLHAIALVMGWKITSIERSQR